ncbi:monofunctional biosynthetic peptidoglycan transglycosylase [Roseovarius nanhaiticus]|uniref:Biosynthetic peptidoglycan transglycosylase n=1 Tax=Roseovarius nanhaiticus TaxID=573024 RepID=A0A1N7EG17_9RHOB|nr:monofunctional biosynthetic peptidoglycan transglycosylase [Roseovarius nanhaiticus]SEK75302.1 monofunctional biosynthetic peptidoglycan transglycosylase [Roseovarius nanhaiticus]SIR87041.1 monofunctional biosynthetic peptidoglycan transglycosylase [Roseovarius nanhaiticus]
MPRSTTKDTLISRAPLAWLRRWALWLLITGGLVIGVAVVWHRVMAPGPTFYMKQEARRLGQIAYVWTPIDDIAPVMARAAVAAEDADFCNHWGFDMRAIRQVLERGGARGASTISQQTVKNVYLWHGRSWPRKALEAVITPAMEAAWSKRRIIEVYLNVAEFDEGIFGIGPAARHYFGVEAADLSALQAARLAAILPDPKGRSASRPSNWVRKRTASIMDGAATIRRDGRAACFED